MRKPTLFLTGYDTPPLVDINTTPLIDVLLVLLIMMIITMPLATHAVKIDLPGDGRGIARASVALYVDYDGALYWNDEPVNSQTLAGKLQQVAAQREQPNVLITANRLVKYDHVAHVLAAAQRSGVMHIGFAGNRQFD
jgi:biopolymer transport protein ExbD